MLILAKLWRGFLPLLCVFVYELVFLSDPCRGKPRSVVSTFFSQYFNKIKERTRSSSELVFRDYKKNIENVNLSVSENLVTNSSLISNESEIIPNEVLDNAETSERTLTATRDILDSDENIPLNFSMFTFPPKWNVGDEGHSHLPRYMMEYFAITEEHSRKLPQGATLARSFPVVEIESNSIENAEDAETDQIRQHSNKFNQKSQHVRQTNGQSAQSSMDYPLSNCTSDDGLKINRASSRTGDKAPCLDSFPDSATENREGTSNQRKYYKFSFNLRFPKHEEFHSAVLRVFVKTKREPIDVAGVERRIRVYITHCQNNASSEGFFPRRTQAVVKDLYLFNNAWSEVNVTDAVRIYKDVCRSGSQTLEIEISPEFYGVGGLGELDIHTDLQSFLRPFLVIFSSTINSQASNDISEGHSTSKRSKRSISNLEWEEEETNSIWDGMSDHPYGIPPHLLNDKKLSKKARRRRAKNSCKIKPLNIVFKDIGWDRWIIAPLSYEAYQCSGKCFYPLASHLTPTKHAVVQNLVHSLKSDLASRACCVPTKLGSISLLYFEAGIPTYNYNYSEMVVLECGCR